MINLFGIQPILPLLPPSMEEVNLNDVAILTRDYGRCLVIDTTFGPERYYLWEANGDENDRASKLTMEDVEEVWMEDDDVLFKSHVKVVLKSQEPLWYVFDCGEHAFNKHCMYKENVKLKTRVKELATHVNTLEEKLESLTNTTNEQYNIIQSYLELIQK